MRRIIDIIESRTLMFTIIFLVLIVSNTYFIIIKEYFFPVLSLVAFSCFILAVILS